MKMTEDQIAEAKRATARARAVLKPGDKLLVRGCADTKSTVKFKGFVTGMDWIYTARRDDIHANHILKVNGVPTSFKDPK